jgi:hypothetical protein
MPAPTPASVRYRERARLLAVPIMIALVALTYAGGHLDWYRQTPLGQIPVVDEQENLMLGEMIVRGELAPEPFYRAMGYPLMLAALRGLGAETNGLFRAALVLGILLHAANAALVAAVAASWFGRIASVMSGLLMALNPVLVHYATQALDATPALTLFLIGLAALAPGRTRASEKSALHWRWIIASVAWAGATALRPNYLLAWAVLPVAAFWLLGRGQRARGLLAAASGATVFAGVAAWQWRVSGVAGFLPWQGAYNLWAANQPDSHGRFFVQRVSIPSSVSTLNPTRAESIYLYRQETGAAPSGIEALNRYWRGRFFHHISAHPLGWLGLLARKGYALLNDWDQYNNKTFAFHRARSPWLRWNPLGWGVVLVLGIAGAVRLWHEQPNAARAIALIGSGLTAGVLLFFVSGRFRLPLAAVATIFAGGAMIAPATWRAWPRRRQMWIGAALIGGAVMTFSNFGGVRDRRTFVEDHALLARAAERIGDTTLAWRESNAALALNPNHRDAMRVAVVAYFNALVRHGEGPSPESQWLEISRRFLAAQENDVRDLQAVAVIALWRANHRVDAVEEWRRLGPTPSAIAARLLVGDRTVSPADLRAAPESAWSEPLVRLAAARLQLAPPAGIAPADPRRADEVLQLVFER